MIKHIGKLFHPEEGRMFVYHIYDIPHDVIDASTMVDEKPGIVYPQKFYGELRRKVLNGLGR